MLWGQPGPGPFSNTSVYTTINSTLLISPTWYIKVSHWSHVAVEQNTDLKHMVLKPLPHPMITRDSSRRSRPVGFPPCLTWLYYRLCSHGSQEEVASQTSSLLFAGLWESLEMKCKALASEIVVLCALDWRENCLRLTSRWRSWCQVSCRGWTAVVNRLDQGEQKPHLRKTAGPGHQDS